VWFSVALRKEIYQRFVMLFFKVLELDANVTHKTSLSAFDFAPSIKSIESQE
jgi:hypothetical protein